MILDSIFLIQLIITVLFEKDKMDKIVNILRGTIDGIKKH